MMLLCQSSLLMQLLVLVGLLSAPWWHQPVVDAAFTSQSVVFHSKTQQFIQQRRYATTADDGGLTSYLNFLNSQASSPSSQQPQAQGQQQQYQVQQVQERTVPTSFRPDGASWLPKVPPEVAALQNDRSFSGEEATTGVVPPSSWTPPTPPTTTKPSSSGGNIFSVQQPTDLLDFLAQDGQVCIVKVWTSWCRSCKALEPKYRKLAKDYAGNVRFAEIEYTPLEELCQGLQATKLPHILVYQKMRKQTQFVCLPQDFKKLSGLVHHLVTTDVDDGDQPQDISLSTQLHP